MEKHEILNPKNPLTLSLKGLKMVVNRHQSKKQKNYKDKQAREELSTRNGWMNKEIQNNEPFPSGVASCVEGFCGSPIICFGV